MIDRRQIDFLDISLWDSFKLPEEEAFKNQTLLAHFKALNFGSVKWTVAGNIRTGEDVRKILEAGVDFVSIGRAAILHHDFPVAVIANPDFKPEATPVSEAYLRGQGLGEKFIQYMRRWPDFVK